MICLIIFWILTLGTAFTFLKHRKEYQQTLAYLGFGSCLFSVLVLLVVALPLTEYAQPIKIAIGFLIPFQFVCFVYLATIALGNTKWFEELSAQEDSLDH